MKMRRWSHPRKRRRGERAALRILVIVGEDHGELLAPQLRGGRVVEGRHLAAVHRRAAMLVHPGRAALKKRSLKMVDYK